jgi:hypothetical protein
MGSFITHSSYVSEYGVFGEEMTTVIHNVCTWYDGTMRSAKGHNDGCQWNFDGQIWEHL